MAVLALRRFCLVIYFALSFSSPFKFDLFFFHIL